MRIVLLFCALLVFACSDATDEEQELYRNYRLLRAYFYHPERIKEYEEYMGIEVDAMYESLKDYFCGANHTGGCNARYTFYLPPEKSDDKISEIENTPKDNSSFGFERSKNGDTLTVEAVYPISPAANAGLRKKDKLLFANGVSLTGENAAIYLQNDREFDTLTVFEVLRDGEEKTLDSMRKAEVQKPTIYLDSLEDIPLIRVTEYKVHTNNPSGTYAEFKNILQEIKGAKTAIMDLRNNGGGSIWHCTKMAAELVPLNSELVYDEEHRYSRKNGNVIEISHEFASDYLEQEGDGVNIKWIVLINRGSASCSERFLAALKYNRPETVVIGQTSYGKGIGQVYAKTYLGGLAYITCLQTFYPNGETFHNIGIAPDIPTAPGEEMGAIKNFGLAKRSSISARSTTLPPERLAENTEPRAYKRIEIPLFH